MRSSRPGRSRPATLLAGAGALLALALAGAGSAAAAPRLHPGAGAATASGAGAEVARVERYWTPGRMRAARPLELEVDGSGAGRIVPGAAAGEGATASFNLVPTPELAPYSVNGRIFLHQGKFDGFCSGTAINSPTRQLVLTAGHCVATGPEEGHASIWSSYLEFVPAYSGDVAPFGAFVARRGKVFAPKEWIKQGNPDFDMGAFLTLPNAEGVDVADAVGGGATIVSGLSRHQVFQTYGYPGETKRMQTCQSPYIGDDTLTYPFPGPPTQTIQCRWAPGASGGGWMIGAGAEIDGITTYLHRNNKSRTYGPYFSKETVGKLVEGL
jgi:hypothetical protein